MANLQKVIADWTGFTGAPGYSVFYRGEADVVVSRLQTFYESVKTLLPSGVNVKVRTAGDLVDSGSGALTGSWTTGAGTATVGTGSGVSVGGAGCVVRWATDGIHAGRRVRGRTFLIPLASGAFEANGTLLSSALSTINAAATALVTAETGNLMVWHRPVAGAGGAAFAVTYADVPDRSALMRSRRD